MASHSVAEAETHLSELIDKAIGGEEVVITRHGAPMVVLKPIARQRRPVSKEDVEWLERHRIKGPPPAEDAGSLVSRMRDEDWR
jgi:prevent-host-death family protein